MQTTLINHRDIQIFPAFGYTDVFYCTSLEGKRAIGDVFDILDNAVRVGYSNRFVLQEVGDDRKALPTVYRRGASGAFKPGRYIIVPLEPESQVFRTLTVAFEDGDEQAPCTKQSMVSDTATEESTTDDDPRGFKMRLVYRDKGCVVCHAEGRDSVYQYRDDSMFFEASHIFPFTRQSVWHRRGYQSLIADPYTATSAENATRNKQDPLRINSLENGILLCLPHHVDFDTLRLSIHPTTHKIFAFHPAVSHLHGLQVTSPWKAPTLMYPGPHHDLLKAHYQTSIFASLSAAAEPLDDDDEDLLEIQSNHNKTLAEGCPDGSSLLPRA